MHLNSFIGFQFQSSDTCGKIHYYVRTNWFFFGSCYLHLCSVNDWNVHCVVNGDILPLFISQALYYTGNSNADLAAAWVIENQHRSNIDAPLNVSRVIVKCWCLLLYQSYRIKKHNVLGISVSIVIHQYKYPSATSNRNNKSFHI